MENKIFDKEFFNKLKTMSLQIKALTEGGQSGVRRSKSKGTSVEFSDFREYNIGDDIRRIDWNAYGRFEKLFIKLFVEEKEANINIYIDCSKSMDFEEKREVTLKISAVVAYLALNNQDKVNINLITRDGIKSEKYSGILSFQRILNFIEKETFEGTVKINNSIKRNKIKSKGLSIIISDFLNEEDIEDSIRFLKYCHQEILIINVLSDSELNPKLNGEVTLVDSESDKKVQLTVTSKILINYKKALERFTLNLKNISQKYGGKLIQVSSNESIDKIIFDKLFKEGVI
ncbi:DUF58 domain-containing protein [Clostridium ihumii]|uniref:DUF58 domain-containing protein n=1 Tax=Clostridium ihumii TaxID=1470356 RepID=UPI00058B9FD6|nr:DUF58 domain-containing protein [Clostridium ihumii]